MIDTRYMRSIRTAALSVCVAAASACATTKAPSHETDVARVRLSVAADRIRYRDWPAALQALEPMPDDTDLRAAALTLRGTVLREKRLLEEGEADLKDALELRPDLAAAHAALAVLYDLRGDVEQASTHHKRAVELEPENASYLNDFAVSLYARGKARDAVPVYQRALRIAPDNVRIRNNFGFALARAGEFSRAAQQFTLAGTPAEAKNNLGYAYELAGNLAQAFEQYVEAVRLDPKLERARTNLQHVAATLQRPVPADLNVGEGKS